MSKIRTYTELITLPTFEERFEYVRTFSIVGDDTFGYLRYLNQKFYHSKMWREVKDYVAARDNGNDLGMIGHPIFGPIYIHHLNPLTEYDIINITPYLCDPEFLISVSFPTHNDLHYKRESLENQLPDTRTRNDMCPWKLE